MSYDPFVPPADTTPPTALPPVHYTYEPPPDVIPGPRPPTGLAVAVIVLGWIWVVWLVVLGFAADASEEIWRDAVERELAYRDTASVPFDAAYLPVRGFLVAAFVVVSLWLHQSRRFVAAHDPGHRFRLSAAWTWFGWIVPVLSLWFPARVVADLWRATVHRRVPWFFLPWWACWLVVLWLSWTAEGWLGGFLGADVLREQALVVGESYVVAAVPAALACWAWTAIVLRIRRGQLALASGAPRGDEAAA